MKSLIATAVATLFVLCLSLVAQDKAVEPEKSKKTALDWNETDVAEFSAKFEKASATGEKWTASPESIILDWVGPFVSREGEKAAAVRTIRIFTKGEGLPRTLNVVLIDNGLLDDQIKTQASRLALSRQKDGSWKIRKAFKAQVKWPKPGA